MKLWSPGGGQTRRTFQKDHMNAKQRTKSNYNLCFFSAKCEHSVESDYVCMIMQMKLWERMNMQAARYGHQVLGLRYA